MAEAQEETLGKPVNDSDPISAIALSPDARLMAIAVDNAVKPAVRVTNTGTGERAAPTFATTIGTTIVACSPLRSATTESWC